ncbi:MAG: chloride channel protein [Bacteroidia bacterium]
MRPDSDKNSIERLLQSLSARLKRIGEDHWLAPLMRRLRDNERLRRQVMIAIPFWFASVVVGLVAVGYAQLFSWAESLSQSTFSHAKWAVFILMPTCMIGAWWLVRRFAPAARGSGIPQVLAALELSKNADAHAGSRLLSLRIVVIKIASSLLMALGGAAVGREGPTIQISAAIFRRINTLLPAWWPKAQNRNMILTGAAAGLAAAFNTPLGGIVFAVEELSKQHFSHFRTALFTAVIIAGLTAQGIAGSYLYLGYPKIDDYSLSAFWGVLLVAIIAGILGGLASKAMLRLLAWKSKFRRPFQHLLYLLVCSMILASAIYFVTDQAAGSGKEVMTSTLFTPEKRLDWYVPIARVGAPVVSFTAGASGGVFAPALSAGASVGASVAGWFDLNGPNSNLLILAGMVAFLTGITRSPFTSAILVLEMTDRHSLIFHLMAAGMVANLLAYTIDRKSFYEHLKVRFLQEVEAIAPAEPAPVIHRPPVNDPAHPQARPRENSQAFEPGLPIRPAEPGQPSNPEAPIDTPPGPLT